MIVFLDGVEQELWDAANFYERHTRGLGLRFLADVQQAIDLILTYPESGRLLKRATRRRILKRFPYGVLYKIEQDQVVVVAIMHLSRKPGYWSGRLR